MSWSITQRLELVPLEQGQKATRQETSEVAREQQADWKARNPRWASWGEERRSCIEREREEPRERKGKVKAGRREEREEVIEVPTSD